MKELRFNIYWKLIAVQKHDSSWVSFWLGAEGKRRPAEFVIPSFVPEEEICRFLADLFHESATPRNGEVKQIL